MTNKQIISTRTKEFPCKRHVDRRTMRQAVPLRSSAMKLLPELPLLLLMLIMDAAHAQNFSTDVLPAQQQPMCVNPVLPAPPQKSVYRVGVLAIRGADDAYEEFSPTFSSYLTHMVGSRFTPPITFETVPVTFEGDVLEKFVSAEYDFFYTNPNVYSCMEAEIHANSLVSQISRREVNGAVYDLTEFGGVIFTRSDNEEINDIVDLKNKRIGVVSIAGLGSGQMQFRELQRAGLHHLQDPKQVIFMENQGKIVNAVLRGEVDVGFVRTDQLEQTKDDLTGELADLSLVKLIGGQERVLQNGEPFPFKSSTALYPEWNLGSLPDVDAHVANAVSASLLELADHAAVGLPLQSCLELRNCTDTNVECLEECFASIDPLLFKNCETTSTTALLAANAMEMGQYAGWRSSLSYIELFMMQLEIGFSRKVDGGAHRCIRTTELADAVTCPVGYSKPSNEEIEKTCEVAGLDCYGYSCVCSPCSKESVVEFFPVSLSNSGSNNNNNNNNNMSASEVGCEKFSYCGKVPQGSIITFHAVDNMLRLDSTFTASLLSNDKTLTIPMRRLSFVGPERFVHELVFDASNQPLGVILVAIYADDEQIPESPFRMQVVEHDCAAETGSSLYVSDGNGECICVSGAVEIGGNCVSLKLLLPSIIVPSIVLAILLYFCYKAEKRRRADAIWKVSPEELHFDEPPRVIGRGSFGLVLLAEYKNKKVAVKRVLPPKDGSSVHEGSKFTDDTKNAKSPEMPLSNGKRRLSNGGRGGTVGSAMSSDEGDQNFAEDLEEQNDNNESRPNELLKRRGSQSGAWSTMKFGKKPQVEVDYALLQQEFIQEMRQLSSLRHPCISPDIGAVIAKNSEPLRIMEYMELGSLYDLLHNESMVIEGGMILPILRDIAQGLRFLHEAMPQIVHCDLKAQNVLVDSNFRAKVADFGLTQKSYHRRSAAGTPYWMAPELLRGDTSNTPASDIYAFGIVLYEVFSRKEPYEGEDQAQVLQEVVDSNINKRPPVPPMCPPKVADLMKECLKRNPFDRPQSMDLDVCLKMMTVDQLEPVSTATNKKVIERTQDLLSQLFPKHAADALRAGRKVEPKSHECVTVFFADIVGYTSISSELSPTKVSSLLDRLYTQFDALCDIHNVFKVETVGDAYMAVTNLATTQPEHTRIMSYFALDAIKAASKVAIDEDNPSSGFVTIRAGMHSGPVVGHVVGSKSPRYSLIGDSVNVASRMESSSLPGRLHCTEECATRLMEQSPDLNVIPRGMIEIKGKGSMLTFWVSYESDSPDGVKAALPDQLPASIAQSLNEDIKTKRLIQWNVDVLLTKLKLIMAHREASKLLQHLPGLDQVQSASSAASSAILSLPGVEHVSTASSAIMSLPGIKQTSSAIRNLPGQASEHVSTASSAIMSLPGIKQTSSAIRNLPGQASSAFLSLPGLDQTHLAQNRRPSLALNGHTTLEEVQDIILLPAFNRQVARKEQMLFQKMEIPEIVAQQMHDFVSTIAHMYRDNPFHNFEHASQVALSMTKLLSRIVAPSDLDWDENDTKEKHKATKVHDYSYGIASDPLTQFAVVLSALIHDVDHYGVPNAQLVKEQATIATLYKNRSVAEQNSVDLAWQLLMDPQYDALQKCIFQNKLEMKRFRQLVVNSVMATDIVDKDLKTLRNKRWDTAFAEKPADEDPRDCMNRKATIVIEHLIQASDVGHTMQQWNIYRKWNERFFIECYEAWENGRADKDPTEGWYKGEIGFFDFYIIPLAKKLKDCGVFGFSSDECLQYAIKNRKLWEDQGQQVLEEMIENMRQKKGYAASNPDETVTETATTTPMTTGATLRFSRFSI